MKKLICVFIMIIIFCCALGVRAQRLEGQVVKVDLAKSTLTLRCEDAKEIELMVRENACLSYNNGNANLAMYSPITEEDFISGYLEIDDTGMVIEASFYYLVREGTISQLNSGELILQETESGIYDDYYLTPNLQVYLNNYPSSVEMIKPGMRALLILDHQYRVKKIAAFHYDYIGLIESIDLPHRTMVLNIGSRLNPEFKEFCLSNSVAGLEEEWESMGTVLEQSCFVLAKIIVNSEQNLVTFMDVRSL